MALKYIYIYTNDANKYKFKNVVEIVKYFRDKNIKISRDMIFNYFQKKTKNPNKLILPLSRIRI